MQGIIAYTATSEPILSIFEHLDHSTLSRQRAKEKMQEGRRSGRARMSKRVLKRPHYRLSHTCTRGCWSSECGLYLVQALGDEALGGARFDSTKYTTGST